MKGQTTKADRFRISLAGKAIETSRFSPPDLRGNGFYRVRGRPAN